MPETKPGFGSALLSALAALFGVQNRSNSERDFKHAKPEVLIFGGMIVVMIFVLCVLLAVRVAMLKAGQP